MIRSVTVIACLLAAVAAFAKVEVSAPTMVAEAGKVKLGNPSDKITLDIENEPLLTVLARLFEMVDVSYVLDPEMNEEPEDYNKKVTAKLKNVTLEQALDSLLSGPDLTWRKEDNVIVIEPRLAQIVKQQMQQALSGIGDKTPTPAPMTPGAPTIQGHGAYQPSPRSFEISKDIPAMPIAKAIALVEPGWTFQGDLGQTLMPGVKLSGMRSDVAPGILLIAAGLIPPGEGKVVTSKGQMSMFEYFTQNQTVAYYLPRGTTIAARASATSAGQWLYTIFTWNSPADRALGTLLSVAGVAHVVAAPPTELQGLTVRLYDVTLDEALNNIVPTLGLKYRKPGPADKPTYIIEPADKAQSSAGDARGVTVKLAIAEVVPPSKDKPQETVKNLNSPIISTREGEKAVMKIGTKVPGAGASVAVSVLPTVAEDGRINVVGSVEYSPDGDSSSAQEFTVCVQPGESQTLPRFTVPSGKGKETRTLEVTVTANVAQTVAGRSGF